jgi:hypothetical protein
MRTHTSLTHSLAHNETTLINQLTAFDGSENKGPYETFKNNRRHVQGAGMFGDHALTDADVAAGKGKSHH